MKKNNIIYRGAISKIIFPFLLFFCGFVCFAQLDNRAIDTYQYVNPAQKNHLSFQFNSFNFLKNNEYFGKIADGYTLFGYQLNPKITYQPSSNIKLEVGTLFWKDFGTDKYTDISPTFTLKIQHDSIQYLFGNLDGTVSHRLVEPLMNFERNISQFEQGVQLVKRKSGTFFDVWIDWQKMLYPGQPYKEQIFAGISWVKPLLKTDSWQINIPIQWTAQHRGGQFSTDTASVVTQYNVAVGLEIIKQFTGNQSFVKKIKLQNYWTGYVEQGNYHKYYKDGAGLYLNASANTRWANVMLSYWSASHFQSPNGGDLYQSVGRVYKTPNALLPQRKLLILRFSKDIPLLENLFLTARFEPYYDFGQQLFEHSEGLYLTYRKDFKISKQ